MCSFYDAVRLLWRQLFKRREWIDPDDAPPLTQEQLDSASLYNGDKLIRGKPLAPMGGKVYVGYDGWDMQTK